jgi:myosin heavy subunit
MLIRISLIVAIIAGVTVGALNFVKVRSDIIATRTDRDNERSQKEQAQTELASTQSELSTTKTELTQTKENLEQTTAQKDRAVADANTQTRRANQLNEELTGTKAELNTAQAEVAAYRQVGTPVQVANLGTMLKQAQDSLAEAQLVIGGLSKEKASLEGKLAKYVDPTRIVYLPSSLKGRVVISDPKWDFVVLNVGEDQEVVEDGEFLVNRNGKLVAKVRVASVQKDRSVANVVPGWKLGEILEGDQVIPAHPKS